MTILDYLDMAVKGVAIAWVIVMVIAALALIADEAKPYWRRWRRKHGRRGYVPAEVVRLADLRESRGERPL